MRQVDVKLLEIMPKFQILLNKGDIIFNYNNKRRRLSLLNFPRTAILDFMTSLRCRYCWEAEVLLRETIGQRIDVINSKMAAPGKFKSDNLFCLLLLLNTIHSVSRKICNLGKVLLHCQKTAD